MHFFYEEDLHGQFVGLGWCMLKESLILGRRFKDFSILSGLLYPLWTTFPLVKIHNFVEESLLYFIFIYLPLPPSRSPNNRKIYWALFQHLSNIESSFSFFNFCLANISYITFNAILLILSYVWMDFFSILAFNYIYVSHVRVIGHSLSH